MYLVIKNKKRLGIIQATIAQLRLDKVQVKNIDLSSYHLDNDDVLYFIARLNVWLTKKDMLEFYNVSDGENRTVHEDRTFDYMCDRFRISNTMDFLHLDDLLKAENDEFSLLQKINLFKFNMLQELRNNQHKGDIRDFTNTKDIIFEIEYHKSKLLLAMKKQSKTAIKEYIADIANFLFAIGNSYGVYEKSEVDTNKDTQTVLECDFIEKEVQFQSSFPFKI